jgi:hypothetical protein
MALFRTINLCDGRFSLDEQDRVPMPYLEAIEEVQYQRSEKLKADK